MSSPGSEDPTPSPGSQPHVQSPRTSVTEGVHFPPDNQLGGLAGEDRATSNNGRATDGDLLAGITAAVQVDTHGMYLTLAFSAAATNSSGSWGFRQHGSSSAARWHMDTYHSIHLDRINTSHISLEPLPLGHPASLRVVAYHKTFEDFACTLDHVVVIAAHPSPSHRIKNENEKQPQGHHTLRPVPTLLVNLITMLHILGTEISNIDAVHVGS